MNRPYGLAWTKGRAEICEGEAEEWDRIAKSRAEAAEGFTDEEDKRAALGNAEIAKMRAAFLRELADAYRRILKGEPPFKE